MEHRKIFDAAPKHSVPPEPAMPQVDVAQGLRILPGEFERYGDKEHIHRAVVIR